MGTLRHGDAGANEVISGQDGVLSFFVVMKYVMMQRQLHITRVTGPLPYDQCEAEAEIDEVVENRGNIHYHIWPIEIADVVFSGQFFAADGGREDEVHA
jgi:hypothetical protein